MLLNESCTIFASWQLGVKFLNSGELFFYISPPIFVWLRLLTRHAFWRESVSRRGFKRKLPTNKNALLTLSPQIENEYDESILKKEEYHVIKLLIQQKQA